MQFNTSPFEVIHSLLEHSEITADGQKLNTRNQARNISSLKLNSKIFSLG